VTASPHTPPSVATPIDGKSVAAALRADVATRVSRLSYAPGLAVVLVGDDPARRASPPAPFACRPPPPRPTCWTWSRA
jgi:hypothetical protein